MKKIIKYFYLIKIRLLTLFWMLIQIVRPRQSPLFICLTIDCESKFKNKTDIKKDSYQSGFLQGALKLNELLKHYGWHATFFIDYPEIEIFRYEKNNPAQLIKTLVKNGQDVQLHLHPALINSGKNPDLSWYSEQRIREMIGKGKRVLFNLTGKRVISFRAGGYSVGKGEKIIKVLEEKNFIIDSSVMPGASNLHQAKFDFSKAPYLNWYHPDYGNFSKRGRAKIIELPITTIIKTDNNITSQFFRLDAKTVKIIKNFIGYAYFNNHVKVLTFVWHTKEIFDDDGQLTERFYNIKSTLSFLKKLIDTGKQIKVVSIQDFVVQNSLEI